MAHQPPPSYNEFNTYPSNEAYPPPPQPAFAMGGRPPQQGGYPPQQGGYPPQQGGYPPQQGGYPPQQGGYPPQQGGYPPHQGAAYGGYGQGASYNDNRPAQQNPRYGQPAMPPPLPKASSDSEIFSSSFSDKAIRRGFIRKVYLILFAQLAVTVGFIALFIFVKPVKKWVQGDGSWFYFLAYGTFIVLYFVLVCCRNVRRKSPGNFICLGLFTLAFSYLAATISSYHDTSIVLIAAGITCALCLAISIFAIQTKIDFTMCSGLLFVLMMVLILFGFATLIVSLTAGPNKILNCVYAALGALVFGLFLIYDTQQVIGGRKYEISPEEYIYGALQLYVDVVYIFLFILSFMGSSK